MNCHALYTPCHELKRTTEDRISDALAERCHLEQVVSPHKSWQRETSGCLDGIDNSPSGITHSILSLLEPHVCHRCQTAFQPMIFGGLNVLLLVNTPLGSPKATLKRIGLLKTDALITAVLPSVACYFAQIDFRTPSSQYIDTAAITKPTSNITPK